VSSARAVAAPQTVAGRISDDYTQRTALNESMLSDRLRRAIDQLSVIGAPGEMGLRDARRFGVAGGEVDASNVAARNVGDAYMRGIDLQRPNGNLMLAGEIMKGIGMAYGMGGFGAGAAAPVAGSGLSTTAGGLGYTGTGTTGLKLASQRVPMGLIW
jgi:hypothetical protein